MERYLLFDSGCNSCTEMAQSIQEEANGWLTTCSLHNPRMQALLSQARPSWQWQPTLLEVNENRVRAYTSIPMGVRLVLGLGLRRAWHIAQIVERFSPNQQMDPNRRNFLRQSGIFLAALILLKAPRFRDIRGVSGSLETLQQGELYGGFLLLPEGAPLPAGIIYIGLPNPCGVADPNGPGDHSAAEAIYIELPSAEDLETQGGFPVYKLGSLPTGLKPFRNALVKRPSGRIFGGWVSYQTYDEKDKLWYTPLSIQAQVDFPRPFPLWSSNPVEENGPSVVLQKVDFVPGGEGILIESPVGFTLYWIQQNILYILNVEHLKGANPRTMVTALTKVSQYL